VAEIPRQRKTTLKKSLVIFGLLGLIILCGLYAKRKYYDPRHRLGNAKSEIKHLVDEGEIRNGDIIFQTSLSGQSKAIQAATHSRYSHCGLIYKDGNKFFVFEAVQPVKMTPLDKWIARGQDGKFVIKRLKNADRILTTSTLQRMRQVGETFAGKNYDLTFEWSDNKIYCSELIWKVYKQATGIEIGKLEKLRDFDLTNEVVKKKMKERYGDKLPLDEIVISPAAIFDSDLLTTVKSN
jgi:uncharacterized protein YycO